jgi:CBS domain-containing protein/sporulation protein YlmC with PRC-barrel domain
MAPIPHIFYLSDILGQPVYDEQARELGTLRDVAIVIGPQFPALTKIRLRKGRENFYVLWSRVMGIENHKLILRGSGRELEATHLHEHDLLLYRNVLDKQMVDTTGRKMVRVSDVLLGTIGGAVCVTGVAIGFFSVLRRLGFSWMLRLLPWVKLRDVVVPWDSVVPIHYTDSNLQVNVQLERLAKLHTADLAAILSELSQSERSMILDSLDDEMVADIIEEFGPREQVEILEAIEDDRVPDVVGKMEPDDAADMLQELTAEETADILSQMEEDEADDLRELMEHERDSAGGIMTSEYVAVSSELTAGEVLVELRDQAAEVPAENSFTIFLIGPDESLQGVTNLRDVLIAPPDALVADIMNATPVFAHVEDDVMEAARLVARYDLLALPVVEDGQLVGIITVDDALDVLLPPEWKEYFPREQH